MSFRIARPARNALRATIQRSQQANCSTCIAAARAAPALKSADKAKRMATISEGQAGLTKLDNPSFVLHGIQDVKVENWPIPEPQHDEVLVQISKTGICGSDVHYLQHAAIGNFILRDPMTLGHESSGVVVKLGPGVNPKLKLGTGTRVALEPGTGCRTCVACKSGKYNLCPDMNFAATPPNAFGTLARYYKLPADMLHILPDSVSMEDGAMMEPLAVGVHAVHTLGQLRSGQSVIIFGAGPVGLLCMAVAKGLGARRVIAVDINDERLAFAKQYAATDIVKATEKLPDEAADKYTERMAAQFLDQLGIPAMGIDSIDLAIDCSGAASCIQMGLHAVRPAGRFVQVGMGHNMNPVVPLFPIMTKEVTVVGSFRYGPGDYPMAISLVERGLVDLKPLVTQRYEFDNALEAFETTMAGKDPQGKPAIKCIINAPK